MIKKIISSLVVVFILSSNISCKKIQSETENETGNIVDSTVTESNNDNNTIAEKKSKTGFPDFSAIEAGQQRKEMFFSYLKPLLEKENAKILYDRRFVIRCYALCEKGSELDSKSNNRLKSIAQKYKINKDSFTTEEDYKELLLRVDAIPIQLALVQAANESAWGTSYFAKEGNNIFGQWCFKKGCGLVPRNRPEGETYEVAVYESIPESIAAYMNNLNTNRAYSYFRNLRYQFRQENKPVDPNKVALGLQKYSGIGMEYVDILRMMLKNNKNLL